MTKEIKISFPDLEEELERVTKDYKRNYPQISCTIESEDQEMLNELMVYAANKVGRNVTLSELIRSIIRLVHKHKVYLVIE